MRSISRRVLCLFYWVSCNHHVFQGRGEVVLHQPVSVSLPPARDEPVVSVAPSSEGWQHHVDVDYPSLISSVAYIHVSPPPPLFWHLHPTRSSVLCRLEDHSHWQSTLINSMANSLRLMWFWFSHHFSCFPIRAFRLQLYNIEMLFSVLRRRVS